MGEQAWAGPVALNATEGKCCFNGCDDENSCVTGYCASQEMCLKPQLDFGCNSSPPYGHGARPSWCPAADPNWLASIGPSSSEQASVALFALNQTELQQASSSAPRSCCQSSTPRCCNEGTCCFDSRLCC